MATRFLKISSNGNKFLKSKQMTATSYMIIFNFSLPFSIAQRNSEADEIMQVHINQAIEEINKIVKKLLTPSNELKKTIYVLDQPPEPF